MSASASFSSESTPYGIASKDFLSRAQSALKLNASQLSLLSSLYTEALQQEAAESHCQRYLKSKKAACGRELKDGKCPTHGDDVFAPVDVPGEPVAVAKCPFVKKDNAVCGRNCAKGKNVCPLHIGKTMSSDMIACTFVIQSGPRKGECCGKMFGQRSAQEAGEIMPELPVYCSTHFDAEIKRRIKEAEKEAQDEEKPLKEMKKQKKQKKSKKVEEKEEEQVEEDHEDHEDHEIDLSPPSVQYPSFQIDLAESITASVFRVRDSEKRLLRIKSKTQMYPLIVDRNVYEKEDGVLEIVGYTTDLVNKEVNASDLKREWHPLMKEVVSFYNARDYKIRVASSIRK